MNKAFNFCFAVLVLADLITLEVFEIPELRYFTKPAIVGSLIVLLSVQRFRKKSLKYFVIFALICSMSGDLLLLFTEKGALYFELGLLSFLLAHACYIMAYVHRGYFVDAKIASSGMLIVFYAIFVYLYIEDGLGDRKPFVIAYMFILIALAIVALLRRSYVSKTSYAWVLAGAMLFVLSDSLLAVTTFKTVIPYAGVMIMLTYAMAQWFLVHGALEQDRTVPA